MPTPVSFPLFHVTDPSTGMPLVGGLVWSYAAGTSTPIDTWAAWSPSGGYASKNDNPIVLDSDGNASIYITLPTKLIIETPPAIGQAHGVVLFTLDNLEEAPYNSYVVIGNTVPPTPGTDQLALYTIGTTLYIIDSTGAITSPATAQSIQQQSFSAAAAGGTGDAITATLTPALTSLVDKIRVWVTAAAANTTTIPTFSPNSLTAKTIVKGSNTPLNPGDIPGANAIILLEYNATLDKWVLINPYSNTNSAILQNRQAQNTSGGTTTSGSWGIVPLNTLYEDTSGIVTATSFPGAFSLAPGTYQISIDCPFYASGYTQIRLFNVTGTTVQKNIANYDMMGLSVWNYATDVLVLECHIIGTFIISGSTQQLRVEYQVQNGVPTTGHGLACNFGAEVYAQLMITKIA